MANKTELKLQLKEVTTQKKAKWAEFQSLKTKLKELREEYKTATE